MFDEKFDACYYGLKYAIASFEKELEENISSLESLALKLSVEKKWSYEEYKKRKELMTEYQRGRVEELKNLTTKLDSFWREVTFTGKLDDLPHRMAMRNVEKTYIELEPENKSERHKLFDTFFNEEEKIEKEKTAPATEYGKELIKMADALTFQKKTLKLHPESDEKTEFNFNLEIKSLVDLGYGKIGIHYDQYAEKNAKSEEPSEEYVKKFEKMDSYQQMLESGEISKITFKTDKNFNPYKAIVKTKEALKKISNIERCIVSLKKAIYVLSRVNIKLVREESFENEAPILPEFPRTIKYLEHMLEKKEKELKKARRDYEKKCMEDFDVIEKSTDEYEKLNEKENALWKYSEFCRYISRLDETSPEYSQKHARYTQEMKNIAETYEFSSLDIMRAEEIAVDYEYALEEALKVLKYTGTISEDKALENLNGYEESLITEKALEIFNRIQEQKHQKSQNDYDGYMKEKNAEELSQDNQYDMNKGNTLK